MWHCFVNKEIKTRKDHKCEWCGEEIRKGDVCQYIEGIWEGDGVFVKYRLHPECIKPSNEYCKWNDGFMAYEGERG
jgi:hypothetical protein